MATSNALPSHTMRGPKSPLAVSDRDAPEVPPGAMNRPAIPPFGSKAHTAKKALPFQATSGMPALVASLASVFDFGWPSLSTTIACTVRSALGQVMTHGVTQGSSEDSSHTTRNCEPSDARAALSTARVPPPGIRSVKLRTFPSLSTRMPINFDHALNTTKYRSLLAVTAIQVVCLESTLHSSRASVRPCPVASITKPYSQSFSTQIT